MQLNRQKTCCPNCGSEVQTRSDNDDGPARMTKEEMIETMIRIFGPIPEQGSSSSPEGSFDLMRFLGTVIETIIQKFPQLQTRAHVEDLSQVVSESIQPVLDKLQTIEQRISEAKATAETSVRTLKLMFLDKVASPVLTSKKIKSEEDKLIRVAVVIEETGDTVNSGSESSLRAEIVLLNAIDDNDENNWTCGDFLSRIIKEGDKTMPHFSKSHYIDLNEGVAVLDDLKLGHDKSWTKNSKCKLGVRLAGNNNIRGGVEVREGWTNSFTVCDSRGRLYKKGNPPCLSDPLWKLKKMGRNGDPIKRLQENKVGTVKDFLFLHSVDPTRLKKIMLGEKRKAEDSESWKAIVKHAKTSRIDDTNIYVHFSRSPESQSRGVVFDVVGRLKGLIDKRCFICVDNISEHDMGVARVLLISAFENQNDRISFSDEASLLDLFPHPSNEDFIPVRESSDPSTPRLGYGGSSTDEQDDMSQNLIHPPLNQLRLSATDKLPLESTSLRLQFLNSISLPVFTGTRIQGQDRSNLEVALIDIHTGNIVTSGPGSSAEVEIVVLEGDFDSWLPEDFENNIVRDRSGGKPLLDGEVKTTLKKGKCLVGEIMFTDHSSWTRSRQFRLGARIVDDGTGLTARVREARSEPLTVRDNYRDVSDIAGQVVKCHAFCEAEKEDANESVTLAVGDRDEIFASDDSSGANNDAAVPTSSNFPCEGDEFDRDLWITDQIDFDYCFGEDSSDILISNKQLPYYFDGTDSPFLTRSNFNLAFEDPMMRCEVSY